MKPTKWTKEAIQEEALKYDSRTEFLTNISVLETVEFSVGVQALELERYILNKYKQFKFQGDPLLLSGNTELLTVRPSLCGPKEA